MCIATHFQGLEWSSWNKYALKSPRNLDKHLRIFKMSTCPCSMDPGLKCHESSSSGAWTNLAEGESGNTEKVGGSRALNWHSGEEVITLGMGNSDEGLEGSQVGLT